MKYILYFDSYDNDTYFYNSIEELLESWNYKTLEEFIDSYKGVRHFAIFKISEVIYDSEENQNENR